jgi:hypothetical protein
MHAGHDLLDRNLDLLTVDGVWDIRDGEDVFWHVAWAQRRLDRGFDTLDKRRRERLSGLHLHEEEDCLVRVRRAALADRKGVRKGERTVG